MKELFISFIASLIVIAGIILAGESYLKLTGVDVLSVTTTGAYGSTTTPESTSTDTPTPILTPSSTPEATLAPSPRPTPTVVLPPPVSSQEINGFIERFAGQYGCSPHVLRHLAICESGFNSNARNGPYLGLYQFGPVTWKNNRIKMGEDPSLALRYNAEEAVQTAAFMISVGKIGVWPNCQP